MSHLRRSKDDVIHNAMLIMLESQDGENYLISYKLRELTRFILRKERTLDGIMFSSCDKHISTGI